MQFYATYFVLHFTGHLLCIFQQYGMSDIAVRSFTNRHAFIVVCGRKRVPNPPNLSGQSFQFAGFRVLSDILIASFSLGGGGDVGSTEYSIVANAPDMQSGQPKFDSYFGTSH